AKLTEGTGDRWEPLAPCRSPEAEPCDTKRPAREGVSFRHLQNKYPTNFSTFCCRVQLITAT
ncbi:MAG TPA: hypothetical protein PLS20_09200, partial [Ruminococcus flavefaciens]|nr:hypothetical protein [Ruminococcus flavefaciens]